MVLPHLLRQHTIQKRFQLVRITEIRRRTAMDLRALLAPEGPGMPRRERPQTTPGETGADHDVVPRNSLKMSAAPLVTPSQNKIAALRHGCDRSTATARRPRRVATLRAGVAVSITRRCNVGWTVSSCASSWTAGTEVPSDRGRGRSGATEESAVMEASPGVVNARIGSLAVS
jgi:hypothetical protein